VASIRDCVVVKILSGLAAPDASKYSRSTVSPSTFITLTRRHVDFVSLHVSQIWSDLTSCISHLIGNSDPDANTRGRIVRRLAGTMCSDRPESRSTRGCPTHDRQTSAVIRPSSRKAVVRASCFVSSPDQVDIIETTTDALLKSCGRRRSSQNHDVGEFAVVIIPCLISLIVTTTVALGQAGHLLNKLSPTSAWDTRGRGGRRPSYRW
jgi:hypothetical protein